MKNSIVYSVVVPVYKNAAGVGELLRRLAELASALDEEMEAVFVVDGSPDESHALLEDLTRTVPFSAQLLEHSRNFGSFAAIRTGMGAARGDFIAVMAADLQEPPELVLEFFHLLNSGVADITVGRRESRQDPFLSRLGSTAFWALYRRTVFPDMPEGGVDIFGCTSAVAQEIGALSEAHSSLVGLLYWVGHRRVEVPYRRLRRTHGRSGWSFRKKVQYLLDSIFSFTDLPLTVLMAVGVIGSGTTVLAAVAVSASYLFGGISAPGYTPLMLVILLSTFGLLAALGIVGSYVWRAFENTKQRPGAIVKSRVVHRPPAQVRRPLEVRVDDASVVEDRVAV